MHQLATYTDGLRGDVQTMFVFDTFADWAAIVIVIQLFLLALLATPRWISRAFRWWVNWRTYRTASKLIVLAQVMNREVELANQGIGGDDLNVAYPGSIILFTAMFQSRDGRPMLRKMLSDVTFTPLGDMRLEPLDGLTVKPRDGYARCRFVVTKSGKSASAVAHSGPIVTFSELNDQNK